MMKNIEGFIIGHERLTNSVSGNPRFGIEFRASNGTVWYLLTSSDASCNYTVTNYRPSDRVTLGLTRAGRVHTIEPIK